MEKPDIWRPIGNAAARVLAEIEEKRRKAQDNQPPPEPKRETA